MESERNREGGGGRLWGHAGQPQAGRGFQKHAGLEAHRLGINPALLPVEAGSSLLSPPNSPLACGLV